VADITIPDTGIVAELERLGDALNAKATEREARGDRAAADVGVGIRQAAAELYRRAAELRGGEPHA
jgi:hypothetical protein